VSSIPLVPDSITANDPRLTEHIIHLDQWSPPSAWEDSGCTPDDRAWIEAMADRGLYSKACSAFECGDYYIPILLFDNHYVRLGCATCQCKTCRDCGNGKMRVHRIYKSNPERFSIITSQSSRTLRLTAHYSTPAPTIDAYLDRVESRRNDLATLRRQLEREFSGDIGYTATPEYDPHLRDVVWRVYYLGYDPGHRWFAAAWQQIVGMSAQCESRRRAPEQESRDGLRWMMDAITDVLMLPGIRRAQWEAALQGRRHTTCVGCMRGVQVESMPQVPESGDPAAPYGRCPCGCGGVLERPDVHQPAMRSWFDSHFHIVDTGGIKTYSAKNRSKVGAEYTIPPTYLAGSPSPPPW
jgi:hypothetical protein